MKYRHVLDFVQPHVVWAAIIPAIAAAAGLVAGQVSNRRGRLASASSELQAKQQTKTTPYESTTDKTGRILPNLPQGTTLNQAMGYDQTRREGGDSSSQDLSIEPDRPDMSIEAPGAGMSGSMPPPQAGAYSVAGTRPSASYDVGAVTDNGGGMSTDQYVQLGKLGLQAAQAFGGSASPSPIPQAGSPAPYQPTAYDAARRRRF